jgi:hypothetical protein
MKGRERYVNHLSQNFTKIEKVTTTGARNLENNLFLGKVGNSRTVFLLKIWKNGGKIFIHAWKFALRPLNDALLVSHNRWKAAQWRD